ncbi:MAG: hypothetical protein GEU82_13595 [Luteitalea sp.]|nr:hypothetical protein [Luteitalea sp.]
MTTTNLRLAEETIDASEARVTEDFIAFLEAASARRQPTGPVRRFNQGRAAGCVQAQFTVPDTLAPEHRVGLFKTPRTYDAWIRFANASSQSDREKDVRGMAIRLSEVPGENLTPGETRQDFVLNSHPVMVAANAGDFLELMKAMEAGGLQQARYFLAHPRSALIGLQARQQPTSHLDISYWSTTPYLFGAGRAVKYIARPCTPPKTTRPERITETYLTDSLRTRLRQADACFDFMIQLQTDPRRMPIEDATVEWKEREAPYHAVARIRIPQQAVGEADLGLRCEETAFNPWHSLVEHRPLGGMNRARRDIYHAMAEFRRQRRAQAPTD